MVTVNDRLASKHLEDIIEFNNLVYKSILKVLIYEGSLHLTTKI